MQLFSVDKPVAKVVAKKADIEEAGTQTWGYAFGWRGSCLDVFADGLCCVQRSDALQCVDGDWQVHMHTHKTKLSRSMLRRLAFGSHDEEP